MTRTGPVVAVVGVVGVLGLMVFLSTRKAEAVTPEPEPEPPPEADFFMPGKITDMSIREHDILQWHYWEITYRLPITNCGGAPATYRLEWKHDWDGNVFSERSTIITLGPGETYNWSDYVDIDFTRAYQGRVRLYGDWPRNNYSKGIVIEGVPV